MDNEYTIFSKTLNIQNKQKEIKIVCDDLANIAGEYDLVVCSAFKNDYLPIKRTVIGKLDQMGISVKALSASPEIDCKSFGVWISEETGSTRFKRVCCVELLDFSHDVDYVVDLVLKKTFSTLKYAIEQASIAGIPTKRIILPILGAGSQGIEMSYIVPPLINQVMGILNLFDVDEITFFEINAEKAVMLKKYMFEALDDKDETDVFISYSSKQIKRAYEIAAILRENKITYWMAPDSIPPSEDYIDRIANALTNTKMVLLLLTPEAEASQWVKKEVGTAIGANKPVVPCQFVEYGLSPKFKFLLEGCQIFPCYSKDDYVAELISVIRNNIKQ